MTSVDEVLVHHGVKGMHWGQRKMSSPTVKKSVSSAPAVKGSKRELVKSLVSVGAIVATAILLDHGDKILTTLERKTAPRSSTPGLSATPAKTKFAKTNRAGVHKITTMK